MPTVNPLFLTYSHKCIINLLLKSGLTVPIFLSMTKTYDKNNRKYRSKMKHLLNLTILNAFFTISKRDSDVRVV